MTKTNIYREINWTSNILHAINWIIYLTLTSLSMVLHIMN